MSRFSSPPPVYARNWANGQNLVESTKIERQIVESKKVHRKKDKKENKKQKKLKNEKSITQLYSPTKQVSDESEHLEKSCLTEEHGQQISVAYLSDGSQNSKKRRRGTSPAVESQIKAKPVAGKPLRIRFVFNKPKEVVVVPQETPVCSTSGTERLSEQTTSVSGSKICNSDDSLLSTSLESDKTPIPSESKKRKKHKPSKASLYNALFDEWVPPSLLLKEEENNNDDWLFSKKRQENAASIKDSIKNDEDTIMSIQHTSEDSCSFPRARFLSEVGIFALPYTVPF